jgi:hypothetical protein
MRGGQGIPDNSPLLLRLLEVRVGEEEKELAQLQMTKVR